MPWTWIEGEIIIVVEDLDIWQNIAGIGGQETELGREEN